MNDSHVEDGDLGYFVRGARFLQIAFQNYVEASSKLKVLENLIVFFFSLLPQLENFLVCYLCNTLFYYFCFLTCLKGIRRMVWEKMSVQKSVVLRLNICFIEPF